MNIIMKVTSCRKYMLRRMGWKKRRRESRVAHINNIHIVSLLRRSDGRRRIEYQNAT